MSRNARKNVGVIGLGIIGLRAASGLRAVGFQVFVWNRSAKPAPNFLGSAAEVAQASEIIQVFVADASALYDVIDAIGDALTPQHVFICSSTIGPEATLEAARRVGERGAKFLDAPFTGSKAAAEKRQLVYYIGGDDATFLRARPVLEATSKAIVRVGAIGHAATVKVVTNMISAVQVQALAEALAIVKKAGLNPEVLAAAIEQNGCRSGVIELKLPKMIAGDYEPHFSLKHMFKDLQLGIHMANALEIDTPAAAVTAGVYFGALNHGWGELDFAALFKNYATQNASIPARLPTVEKRGQLAAPAPRAPAPPQPAPALSPRLEPVKVEELKSAARVVTPLAGEAPAAAAQVEKTPNAEPRVSAPAVASESSPHAPEADAAADALARPMNYVRRRFVSHSGG